MEKRGKEEVKMRVYISGGITGRDRGEAEAQFGRAKRFIISKGCEAVNPLEIV